MVSVQVTGEFLFHGHPEQVWALLNDDAVLARCIPGCERLTRVGEDQYTATLKVGLAAVKGTYEGKLHLVDKREPESITLKVNASGTTGFVNVNGKMDLLGQSESTTRVVYDWEVQVGGPVAMVGQRVLGGVAKWIIGEFFQAANKELKAKLAG